MPNNADKRDLNIFGTMNYDENSFFESYLNGYAKGDWEFNLGGKTNISVFSSASTQYAEFYTLDLN